MPLDFSLMSYKYLHVASGEGGGGGSGGRDDGCLPFDQNPVGVLKA